MARKSPSRLEMRRQAEAAETEAKKAPKKKAVKRKKATRKKKAAKAEVRRRLMWGVFTGSMKEESRFAYDQREAAVERIEQLRAKNAKKLYFIQPIKEPLEGEATPVKIAIEDEDEVEKVADAVDEDEDEADDLEEVVELPNSDEDE